MNRKIIIATGGTGGHIFPARSVAKSLSKKEMSAIIFADKNYIKYKQQDDNFICKIIPSSQIQKQPFFLIKAFTKILLGIFKASFFIIKYNPEKIISFGGYATFPTLVAAIILRKPIILHEQNAHLGKVNRIFGKFAQKIALSYPKTTGISSDLEKKTVFTGNPIRDEIASLNKITYKLPNFSKISHKEENKNMGYKVLLASDNKEKDNMDNDDEFFHILVIGGSGGAKIFSEILPKAFFNLREDLKNRIYITQQCREESLDKTFEQYQKFNLNILINKFFNDMDKKIAKAHLIIARSGSSSLAEFSAAKKPMILIPFALATDNHQEKNANFFKEKNAAIVIKEKDLTINNLTQQLEKLIDNPNILIKMSKNSAWAANLNATSNLIKIVNE